MRSCWALCNSSFCRSAVHQRTPESTACGMPWLQTLRTAPTAQAAAAVTLIVRLPAGDPDGDLRAWGHGSTRKADATSALIAEAHVPAWLRTAGILMDRHGSACDMAF